MGHLRFVPVCILLILKEKIILITVRATFIHDKGDIIMKALSMKTLNSTVTIASLIMLAVLAAPVLAGPPEGKGGGGGKKDDSTSSGGNGFNTPNPISMTIDFRNAEYDSIKSDIAGSYSDEPRDAANPDYRMDAHIDGDSGSSYGNLFLLIQASDRTVYVDIASGCGDGCNTPDEQNQPFTAREFDSLGLTVSATETIAGGLCGMSTGNPVTAPMQIIYDDLAEYGTEAPGFIDFFPASKRKSPCFNQTSEVKIERLTATSWKVSGDLAACITWPGGREYGGVSVMPFELTAQVSADSSLQCQ
jgi:hypothetical protein